MNELQPKKGFDWARLHWVQRQEVHEVCCYCANLIPDDCVPLRLWSKNRDCMAVFCDPCMRKWWGLESYPEEAQDGI